MYNIDFVVSKLHDSLAPIYSQNMKLRLPLTSEIKRIGIHSSSFFSRTCEHHMEDRPAQKLHTFVLYGKRAGQKRNVSRYQLCKCAFLFSKAPHFCTKEMVTLALFSFIFLFVFDGLEKERNRYHVRNRIVTFTVQFNVSKVFYNIYIRVSIG